MKMVSKFLVGSPCCLMILLAAGCPAGPMTETPDSGTPMGDTGTPAGDTGMPTGDTGTPLDVGPPPDVNVSRCTVITAEEFAAEAGTTRTYSANFMPNILTATADALQLIVNEDTGRFDLAMQDNFASCDQCFVGIGDLSAADPIFFFQTGGTLVIDPSSDIASGNIDATVTNLTLGEVTIENYVSTPVPDGDCLYLASASFHVTNTAPTLASASAARVGTSRFYVEGTGMDAESNAQGFSFQLLDAAGTPVSVDPDDALDIGPFYVSFDAPSTGPTFTAARGSINGVSFDEIADAVRVRINVYDTYNLMSATRDVAIMQVAEVGLGQACDATNVCAPGAECTAGTCQATSAVRAACMSATAVTLVAPTGSVPTVATQAVAFAAGDGLFLNECGGDGAERLFNVTVPTGGVDLIVTTNVAGTMTNLDTVVAVRATCADALAELACSDDYELVEEDLRSLVIIEGAAAGTYTVIVDLVEVLDAATTASVELRLRPVLAAGAACDPRGVMNRCSTAPCPALGEEVCPAS